MRLSKLFITLLMFSFFIAAASGQTLSPSGFYFKLDPKASQMYFFGFANEHMSNSSTLPSMSGDTFTLESVVDVDAQSIYGFTDELYIFWRMVSVEKVNLKLQVEPFYLITDSTTGAEDTSTSFSWTIKAVSAYGDANADSGIDIPEAGITVSATHSYIVHKNIGTPNCWGSIQFSCETEHKLSTVGRYRSDISLIIEAAE